MALVAPSFDDIIAIGTAELQDRRADLAVNDGDVTEADLHAAGVMSDAVVRFGGQAFRATWFDTAEKAELTALVNDRVNQQRFPATPAQLTLRFTRTSGGAAGTIAAGTTVGTAFDASGAQVTFTTDTPITVPLASNGPFDVAATATISGTAGNVASGKATKIQATLFDASFSVTNLAAAGGGNDEESDDALRIRARNFWKTLRRGTKAAVVYGAKLVPSVRVATAIEDELSGIGRIRVSDQDGGSSLQMVSDVTIEEENWRGFGVLVEVVGGARVEVDLVLALEVDDEFDVASIAQLFIDSVTSRMKKGEVGERLEFDAVITAIVSLYPDEIRRVNFLSVVVGGADVTSQANFEEFMFAGDNAVLRAGTITVQAAA